MLLLLTKYIVGQDAAQAAGNIDQHKDHCGACSVMPCTQQAAINSGPQLWSHNAAVDAWAALASQGLDRLIQPCTKTCLHNDSTTATTNVGEGSSSPTTSGCQTTTMQELHAHDVHVRCRNALLVCSVLASSSNKPQQAYRPADSLAESPDWNMPDLLCISQLLVL